LITSVAGLACGAVVYFMFLWERQIVYVECGDEPTHFDTAQPSVSLGS
jgi:hypothetical protein